MRSRIIFLVLALVGGCGQTHDHGTHSVHVAHTAHDVEPSGTDDADLRAVIAIHGGAGPWAVAGYEMGRYALRRLGLNRGSFDLEIVHFTPREVQYSCIADGAAAATGASAGKLNLSLVEATRADLHTVYRRRSNGATISLRVTAAFAERFLNVPRDQLTNAGREVLHLRDEEIFEEVR